MLSMLNRITISSKILAGSIIFSAIVAVALIYILVSIDNTSAISLQQKEQVKLQVIAIEQQKNLLIDQELERNKISLINKVDQEFNKMRTSLLDLSVSWLNEAENNAESAYEKLQVHLQPLAEIDQDLALSIQTGSKNLNEIMLKAVDTYVDGNRVKGNSLVAQARTLADQVQESIGQLQSRSEATFTEISQQTSTATKAVTESAQHVSTSANAVVKRNSELKQVVISILVIFIFASALYSFIMRREVCPPIERLRKTVEDIQQTSDLTKRFEVRTHDEIGITGMAFNRMMERFAVIVTKVSQTCQELDAAMNHLADLMQQAKEGASTQQDATDQVATAINQMAVTVQEVAKHTQQATHTTQDARDASTEGRQVVDISVKSTLELSELIHNANDVIE